MSAQVSPYLGMIVMGVAYSLLASALWPIAALLIPEYQLGTAYGLMQAIQNLGTALITMAAGTIVDEYGYDWLEVSSHVERMFGVWLEDLFCFPENFLRSFKSFIIEIASDSCSPVNTVIALRLIANQWLYFLAGFLHRVAGSVPGLYSVHVVL